MFVEIKTESSAIKIPFNTLSISLPQGIPIDVRYTDQSTLVTISLPNAPAETVNPAPEFVENLTSSATITNSPTAELTPPPMPLNNIQESTQSNEAPEIKPLSEKQQEKLRIQQEKVRVQQENQRIRQEERIKAQEQKKKEREEQMRQKQEAIKKKNEAIEQKKRDREQKRAIEEKEFNEKLGKYGEGIKILNEAGFSNNRQNIKLLEKHSGNVHKITQALLKQKEKHNN